MPKMPFSRLVFAAHFSSFSTTHATTHHYHIIISPSNLIPSFGIRIRSQPACRGLPGRMTAHVSCASWCRRHSCAMCAKRKRGAVTVFHAYAPPPLPPFINHDWLPAARRSHAASCRAAWRHDRGIELRRSAAAWRHFRHFHFRNVAPRRASCACAGACFIFQKPGSGNHDINRGEQRCQRQRCAMRATRIFLGIGIFI